MNQLYEPTNSLLLLEAILQPRVEQDAGVPADPSVAVPWNRHLQGWTSSLEAVLTGAFLK